MAAGLDLICGDEARRARVAESDSLHGIDYLEVATEPLADNQRLVRVYFVPKTRQAGWDSLHQLLDRLNGATERVTIRDGVRVQHIKVTQVSRAGDHLEVRVDGWGDFSSYRLTITDAALDPAYAQCDFSFKAGCPSRFDCRTPRLCPAEPQAEPLIDYLAKDYASFRQALLDLIPTLAPQWQERHEADLGIALVELLAYVGDQLSYYQDAVAVEAYLGTARQRLSVRRHARLIDYRMHDGASARVFIFVNVASPVTLPKGAVFCTRIDTPLGSVIPAPHSVLRPEVEAQAIAAADAVFMTMADAELHAGLGAIPLHTWGNAQCCLSRGATAADLVGDLTAALHPGDFLLFEEIKGPGTGSEADADPAHRQVVRLTNVERINDPIEAVDVTRVTWSAADALTFPLCLSSKLASGEYEERISLARGNLVLADHGCRVTEWHPGDPADPEALRTVVGPRPYRFRLQQGPLSFRVPPPPERESPAPATAFLATDSRRAQAQVTDLVVTSDTGSQDWGALASDPPPPDLLESGPLDRRFTVETDNEGRAWIRFGDGEYGQRLPGGARIRVTYRVGVGASGNVGAESLVHMVRPTTLASLDLATGPDQYGPPLRNPLPAWGGTDPEPIDQVKHLAPAAFQAEQFRAVTADDYARAAERHPEVSRAVATFRWTGSWHTVFVSVDPKGQSDLSPELAQRIRDWVMSYTLAGYDLEIGPPRYVPLDIGVEVCAAPDHFRGDVEQAVRLALSNRLLSDGKRGFFHPDNFTFAQPLYLSALYAAITSVEGVESAVVTRLQRFAKLANNELEQGYIPMGRLEIARLDHDPNFPESGLLELTMRGGR